MARRSAATAQVRTVAPFTALDWQIPVWRSRAPVLLLTGSAGGGKSRIAAEKVHAYLLKYAGATALVLRKARESLTNSTVAFLDRVVVAGGSGVQHVASAHQFRYANGSTLVYGGMFDDKQRQQIRSVGSSGGVDLAWLEEATAFTEDDYNEVKARLRGKAGSWRQIILSTNPDSPQHWIYKRLILGGEAEVHYSAAIDNPNNPAEYLDTLASLSGVLGDRLARGLWVQAEGAVYEDWDESLHLIDEFAIPDSWRRIRAIDFGYENPFVCQWWALDNDDGMYLYRELYGTHTLVEDWAARILELTGDERIEATICDHDAEGRATLVRHGVPTVAADKGIEIGLQRVASRLQTERLHIMRTALVDDDPALADSKRPTCTAQEFGGYVWPKTSDGRTVKEVPVKVNDHGLDALRYAVAYVDKGLPPPTYDSGDRLLPVTRAGGEPAIDLVCVAGVLRFGLAERAHESGRRKSFAKILR